MFGSIVHLHVVIVQALHEISESFLCLKSYLFLLQRKLKLPQCAVAWFLDEFDKLIQGLH